MSGRLVWAPVEVVAVSIAAQAHIIFAPGAVLVGALALAVGVTRARRRAGWFEHGGRRWLGWAGGLGLLVWVPTVIAEFSSPPGNVRLILRSERSGAGLGTAFAMHGAASAVALPPSWFRVLPQAGGDVFFRTLGQMYGASTTWWYAALAVVVAAIGWGARRRNAAVVDIGVLTLVTTVAVVATVARVPGRMPSR